MKTGRGHDYGFRWGSARLMDLAEDLLPVLNKWAHKAESKGSGITLLLSPHDHKECPHSVYVFPDHKTRRVPVEDPRWHVFSRRES